MLLIKSSFILIFVLTLNMLIKCENQTTFNVLLYASRMKLINWSYVCIRSRQPAYDYHSLFNQSDEELRTLIKECIENIQAYNNPYKLDELFSEYKTELNLTAPDDIPKTIVSFPQIEKFSRDLLIKIYLKIDEYIKHSSYHDEYMFEINEQTDEEIRNLINIRLNQHPMLLQKLGNYLN